MLAKGTKLNKYEIIEPIGRGGEAIVYRAIDTFTHAEVALKVIHEGNILLEPEVSKLFIREGEILAKVTDDGIVKILESNVATIDGKETFYHAMELVKAPTLDAVLANKPLNWRDAVRIFREIARVVGVLHNREDYILHRDLKPSNIFLIDIGSETKPAQIKLFDFGLAKRKIDHTITAPDIIRGTMRYLAPELLKKGGKASKASDIYSLGISLEEIVSDQKPPEIPEWICDLKNLMCDKNPEYRINIDDVCAVIDEELESKSWIAKKISRLFLFRNKNKLRRLRMYSKLITISLVTIIAAAVIFNLFNSIRPGLKIVARHKLENPIAIEVRDNYAYIPSGYSGLLIQDISNPKKPITVGKIDTDGFATNVTVHGKHAFVSDGFEGLKIIDVSNPSKPVLIGAIDSDPIDQANEGAITYDVEVIGNLAYVADEFKGMKIIDISNLADPKIIGECDTEKYAYDIEIDKNHAFIADETAGLAIIDILDPTNPKLTASVPTHRAKDVIVSGNYLYMADGESGLIVFNISNRSKPTIVLGAQVHSKKETVKIEMSGSYIYAADSNGGFFAVDISKPDHPSEVSRKSTGKPVIDVSITNDNLYTVGDNEMTIWKHKKSWNLF